MTQLQELVVPFILDDKQFNSGMEGAMTKASFFGNILANLATGAISGAFNLLGQGINTVKGFLTDTVNEAMSSQDALSQLEAVIKSTGGVAGVTSQQAQDLASSLQKVTRFSDEAILGGENMLLTFTSIGKEVFPRATETILDMSQALGQDLKSSAIQLGKALNDPITGVTALRRVGVQFSDEQEEMIKKMVESGDLMKAQTFILDELQKEFGGSAEAAGKTFGGQLEILKNKLSDMKENIGNALLPTLQSLAERFSNLLDSPAVQKMVDTAVSALSGLGDWITTNVPGWIDSFSNFVEDAKGKYDELKKKFDEVLTLAIDDKAYKEALKENADSTDVQLAGMIRNYIQLYDETKSNLDGVSKEWKRLNDILGLTGGLFDTNVTWVQILGVVLAPLTVKLMQFNIAIEKLEGFLKRINDSLDKTDSKMSSVNAKTQAWNKTVNLLATALSRLAIPWWLTPGSPTPLENGLRGIDNALGSINSKALPKFASNLDVNVTNQSAPRDFDYNKLAKLLQTAVATNAG